MGRYSDIIARLESASGPDRVLDFAIAETLDVLPRNCFGDEIGVCRPVTASLDAAIGLVERVLSGWTLAVYSLFHGDCTVGFDCANMSVIASHRSSAIALLIALFRALEAQEAGE